MYTKCAMVLEYLCKWPASRSRRTSVLVMCGSAAALAMAGSLLRRLERATGIEPVCSAWKADVLPLYYARSTRTKYTEYLSANKRKVNNNYTVV